MSQFRAGERVIYWPTTRVDGRFEERKGEIIELLRKESDGWCVRFASPIDKHTGSVVVLSEIRFKKIEEIDCL